MQERTKKGTLPFILLNGGIQRKKRFEYVKGEETKGIVMKKRIKNIQQNCTCTSLVQTQR
ncbi:MULTISPECIES: hypothetical protein [unclassified Salinivibrio]|uniref:hypothetical protein n=1 Tax=unclassified Salinivibrio TaxID=2636825 RepID=UPI00128DA135|nr:MULTISPECIES: hypothetical protein [unclassified Salinivibrio]MPS31235.1 hypothetical protein [Salinivibrio sp. VYel7]MPX89227.1 hypothetical protein [Salinivibrio sp. VYel1]MPX92635.1 hypothetical protein [Salinivibrio sp. VYel9]MPX96866.1 hypothetical protein [Salinivibrio sp. VYel6]MPX98868.1 hypothetical protein [Salinivibrio sp. VYel4]